MMPESSALRSPVGRSGPIRLGPWVLVGLIAFEVAVFSKVGTNFATLGNLFEVLRLAVEVGLLALALTPVIVAGGIDLSVGSLMGLSAVVFGMLWRDRGYSVASAAFLTLIFGGYAGALNGFFVTRLKIPPLIVTLGTFSLFRGLAEGLTGGVDNFTHFPDGFLFLGQGYLAGGIPTQLPIFVAVAVAVGLLLGRSTVGRCLVAIGYSPEGARYAGIPVARRVGLTYVISGSVASLAAILYVAHLGQAKADAGTGYELLAITAVVLGGTSIFGGRGGVGGTLLGLAAITTLQNGLRLADYPAELAGIVTGVLLLVAIGLDRRPRNSGRPTQAIPSLSSQAQEVFAVKNAQVAVICASIVFAGLIVAATMVFLVSSLRRDGADASTSDGGPATATIRPSQPRPSQPARPLVVAMMPKTKGNAYFKACRIGAEEAAKALNVQLIWDGPTDPDPAKQNEVIDTWITRGVDVIAVAVENREGISSVLRKARSRGIKVITWDADAEPDARTLFVNQATPEGVAEVLLSEASKVLGDRGKFAIITGSLTAGNMVAWQKAIEALRSSKYPGLRMAALRSCDDIQKKAFDEATNLMGSDPEIGLFMGICTPAVPGAAEAVKQAGRSNVKVIGLGLPNDNKPYVHEGVTSAVILWKTADLGYLTVAVAKAVAEGTLSPESKFFETSRLGRLNFEGDNLILGRPFAFTKENIDGFDF